MIKGITKSPMVRNLAIGAMFAGAVAAGQAAKPVTNPQTDRPLQEQVMSAEASQALLAVVMSQNPSTERNTALETRFLACAKPNALGMDNKEGINQSYQKYGSAFTIMNLQAIICESNFDKTVDKFHNAETAALREQLKNQTKAQSEEYRTAMLSTGSLGKMSISDYFCERLDGSVQNLKKYYHDSWVPFRDSYMIKALQAGNGKPSAKTCSDYMDKLVADIPFFTATERQDYNNKVKAFESTLSSSAVDQTNLIAFKLYTIDSILIKRALKDFEMINGKRTWNSAFGNTYELKSKPKAAGTSNTPKFGLG